MAKGANITPAFNPGVVTLPAAADHYEIDLSGANYTPSHDKRGRGIIRVKALGATNVKFAVGKDPSSSTLALVLADGWTDIAFHPGVNNLWAKGSADNAQFAFAAY